MSWKLEVMSSIIRSYENFGGAKMQSPYLRFFLTVLLTVLIGFSNSVITHAKDTETKVINPPTVSEINNKVYKITKVNADNELLKAVESFVITVTSKEYVIRFNSGDKTASYKIGINDFSFNPKGVLWNTNFWLKGQWIDDNKFRVISREDAESTYTFSFSGNTVVVESENIEINAYSDKAYIPNRLIAHGGGGIKRNNKLIMYSNSLEALNESYKVGHRLIEVDIEWTLDKQLVLVHDWGEGFKYNFDAKARKYSLKEFKLLKMKNGLTQITAKELENWVEKHPDVQIITDIKSKNADALKKISKENPYLKKQLIPQIYAFDQYEKVKQIGYSRSLLALWGTGITDEKKILDFARKNKLFAVSISEQRNKDYPRLVTEFKKLGVFTFIHTINKVGDYEKSIKTGYFGIFTDFISKSLIRIHT
jgi:glycerophosphoryl diester phosphodiesterase